MTFEQPYPKEYEQLGSSIILKEPNQPPRKYGWRERTPTDCGDQKRTKQSFKDDCDINLIVRRHASTGMYAHLNPLTPSYGDFSGVVELQDAIALTRQSEADFAELPARVRAVCNNDPVVFLQEVHDPEGIQYLVDAGLPMAEGWEPPATETPAGDGGEKATPPAETEGVT